MLNKLIFFCISFFIFLINNQKTTISQELTTNANSQNSKFIPKVGIGLGLGTSGLSPIIDGAIYYNFKKVMPFIGINFKYHQNFNSFGAFKKNINETNVVANLKVIPRADILLRLGTKIRLSNNISLSAYGVIGASYFHIQANYLYNTLYGLDDMLNAQQTITIPVEVTYKQTQFKIVETEKEVDEPYVATETVTKQVISGNGVRTWKETETYQEPVVETKTIQTFEKQTITQDITNKVLTDKEQYFELDLYHTKARKDELFNYTKFTLTGAVGPTFYLDKSGTGNNKYALNDVSSMANRSIYDMYNIGAIKSNKDYHLDDHYIVNKDNTYSLFHTDSITVQFKDDVITVTDALKELGVYKLDNRYTLQELQDFFKKTVIYSMGGSEDAANEAIQSGLADAGNFDPNIEVSNDNFPTINLNLYRDQYGELLPSVKVLNGVNDQYFTSGVYVSGKTEENTKVYYNTKTETEEHKQQEVEVYVPKEITSTSVKYETKTREVEKYEILDESQIEKKDITEEQQVVKYRKVKKVDYKIEKQDVDKTETIYKQVTIDKPQEQKTRTIVNDKWFGKYGAGLELTLKDRYFIRAEYTFSKVKTSILDQNGLFIKNSHLNLHDFSIGFGLYFL